MRIEMNKALCRAKARRNEEGFTLVELMVVIVIIGLLATIVALNVLPSGDTARIDWILVGGPIDVLSAETILFNEAGRYPSDHFPVAARVEIR